MKIVDNELYELNTNFKKNFNEFILGTKLTLREFCNIIKVNRTSLYHSMNMNDTERLLSWELMVRVSVAIPNFSLDSIRYGYQDFLLPQSNTTKKLIEYISKQRKLSMIDVSRETKLPTYYVRCIFVDGFEPSSEAMEILMSHYGGFVALNGK